MRYILSQPLTLTSSPKSEPSLMTLTLKFVLAVYVVQTFCTRVQYYVHEHVQCCVHERVQCYVHEHVQCYEDF